MTWCIILLEVAIRGWEHGGHEGMDPIATKGPKVCQENMPHTVTPPPAACTEVTQDHTPKCMEATAMWLVD